MKSRVLGSRAPFQFAGASLLLCVVLALWTGCPGSPSVPEGGVQESSGDASSPDSRGCQPSPEVCDGKDNDCNGKVDDGLTCAKEGDTQTCYTGPDKTKGQGLCKAGTQTFSNGRWGICEGEVGPATEVCDGKDNDCDGEVDEELTQACQSNCGQGVKRCSAGSFGECDAPKPEKEICDGKDNNCDGKTDEGCSCKPGDTQPCGSGEGECKKGTQTCDKDGAWGACTGETKPGKETCNGKDDDCDGKTDEELKQDCYTGAQGTEGKGLCQKGSQSCSGGKWGACTGETIPAKEVCDGKDNDCNGKTDDLPDIQCGKGPCLNTVAACDNGKPATCQPKPSQKETCNGKDDDCDGNVDNGATCTGGATCQAGKCQGGGTPYRTGTFQSPGVYTVVGKVSVFKSGNGETFEFSANFSSSSGPDLYVYLVKVADGAASDSPKNYISLGKLKNVKGAQSYTLNQSSAGYKSIVVWCKLASRNFGYANLSP